MRLTKIKLAGFKSFVDSAIFHLPSNLVGVVGPNGCGKSNIIDAVRWVMGESSARTLRGDSMADVIFNGSATRKPIGQASIELVFDNSAGRLGGPWLSYSEISIKRVVSRDGQSSYFLNSVRCRRRDIIDIFLGTGLGPRSYAIIEQGMISRIIESRPEELRTFLEEAAGISKYKERRRETENRIRHTREHLDRLNDVRDELARQLQHLQRQAQTAERYQHYRIEERRLKAELLVLRWRTLDEKLAIQECLIREQETALEAVVAEQRTIETRLEAGRTDQGVLNEQLSQVQARYYELGMEITRLEQTLQRQRELQQRHIEELQQIDQDLEKLEQDIRLDDDRIKELEGVIAGEQSALAIAQAEEAELTERLEAVQMAIQDRQAIWEEFVRHQSEAQREADLTRTRIEHLERQRLLNERRMARLDLEQKDLQTDELQRDLQELQRREQSVEVAIGQDQSALSRIDAQIAGLREDIQHITSIFEKTQEAIQSTRGRLASLEALQESALGRQEGSVGNWLQERQLDKAPRLGERIDVEPGWEQAVETVLGQHLQALCVTDREFPLADLASLEQGSLTLFDARVDVDATGEQANHDRGALASLVRSPLPLDGLLSGVQTVDNLSAALVRRRELMGHESLITADGLWLGRHWLRIVRPSNEHGGILAREREIKTLKMSLQQDTESLKQHVKALERLRTELSDQDRQHVLIQQAINQAHREHAGLQGEVNVQQARLEHMVARRGVITEELGELRQHTQHDRAALDEARQHLEESLSVLEHLDEKRKVLLDGREDLHRDLEEHRVQVQTARQQAQQQALRLESHRTAIVSTRQAVDRLNQRKSQLEGRREQLRLSIVAADKPVEAFHAQLTALLAEQIATERRLGEFRRISEEHDVALRTLERTRAETERRVQELRRVLENERLSRSDLRVRGQTLLDQLQEMNISLDTVLGHLPAEAQESEWQERLEQLGLRIQRLGAVNLAAIEEFNQLSQRKQYLDSQNDDLVEALTTLENAMHRIDRETRCRFKDTFDRVNQKLQGLFPRLFDGGQAHLKPIGEDLLDAGIIIMAQPPGKRIGNIHLLSGGEKALAAVALVFALFQLNPAPFCMLDEVDAPLDEVNVARFGKLVQEMSEHVQFIFITHNKGTMEIARHLWGVTMQEPGVSRLVTVDVDEAVRLAAI